MNSEPNRSSNKVTPALNVALLTYFLFVELGEVLTEPKSERFSYWDRMFAGHPDLSIFVLLVCFVLLIAVGALVVREFWNRLVTDLFDLRALSYQEALAIMFVVWIIKA
jgi:hypothetical protein